MFASTLSCQCHCIVLFHNEKKNVETVFCGFWGILYLFLLPCSAKNTEWKHIASNIFFFKSQFSKMRFKKYLNSAWVRLYGFTLGTAQLP